MRTPLIAAALMSGFAVTASAASFDAPFALTAPHADFLAQIEEAAATPGEIGPAARAASDLLASHNATEEAVVLTLLGDAEKVAAGGSPDADPQRMQEIAAGLEAELPALIEEQAAVVAALVDLYAAAVSADRPEIASLAEKVIWHETSDAEVLYPAAVLVAGAAAMPTEAVAE